jgi:hypothetical protein
MITILGVDCAVDPRRRGVARGRMQGESCRLDAVWRGDRVDLPDLVRQALAAGPVVLALDAPLGWPRAMAAALTGHRAGAPLPVAPHDLFRRRTDVLTARRLGKTPLDVGADRIARTAHAALDQLADVATVLARTPVPLLWDPENLPELSAVEVYPAGLLVASGSPVVSGYKPAGARAARERIVEFAAGEAEFAPEVIAGALASADLLDAALCVLAGRDVVSGRAVAPADPTERDAARREGWIWNRPAKGS